MYGIWITVCTLLIYGSLKYALTMLSKHVLDIYWYSFKIKTYKFLWSSFCHELLTISQWVKKFIYNIHFTNSLDFLKAILYSSKLQSTYVQAYLSQSPSRLAAFTEKLRQLILIVYFTKGQKTYQTLLVPQKSSIFAVGSNYAILIEYPYQFHLVFVISV